MNGSEVLAVLTAVRLASASLASVLAVARNYKEFNDLYERTGGNITDADIDLLEAQTTVELAETDDLYADTDAKNAS